MGNGVYLPQRWRKKPVVIEAILFDGSEASQSAIVNWTDGRAEGWFGRPDRYFLTIRTAEGEMTANPGDYVIKGVHGEFYPCKPDIFEATYEPAESAPPVEEAADD